MTLIDTHAHLYAEEFSEDLNDVIDRAQANQICRIYLPNIDSTSIEQMERLVQNKPDLFFPQMGLHPCSVKENYTSELDIIEKLIQEKSYHAIGETGLDYYWDTSYKQQQKECFEQQIKWSAELNLPLVIHTRDSIDDAIALIEKHQDGRLTGVFHCFSGDEEHARIVKGLGFHIGIGGVVTFKKNQMKDILLDQGLEKVVLETDSPYLAPTPFRGKRNESSYIKIIAEYISELLNVSLEKVAKETTQNAGDLYNFDPLSVK